jgi:hypothetical protein
MKRKIGIKKAIPKSITKNAITIEDNMSPIRPII